jgi:23S rRNA-/tRNA-specific pseudouridylate synthase
MSWSDVSSVYLFFKDLEKRRGKLFIVHRLDKSTTGPLILAKSSTASRTLSTQFKNSTVKKTYYAAIQFLGDRIGPIQDAKSSGQIECRMRDSKDRMVIAEC